MAKSKGLGDSVEKITKATGIKALVKWVFGEDCGCNERKEYLNKIWRYNVPECLTEEEYNILTEYFSRSNGREILGTDQKNLLKIYNRVFKKKREVSTCTSCLKELHDTMNKLFKAYE